MAQAAERLELPEIRVEIPSLTGRPSAERWGWWARLRQRDRERRDLARSRAYHQIGRATGVRG